MEFLERHRLSNGNCECSMAVYVFAEEDTLCPWLGGEVDLALLHRDLACRGLARSTDLRPNHFDSEEIARDK